MISQILRILSIFSIVSFSLVSTETIRYTTAGSYNLDLSNVNSTDITVQLWAAGGGGSGCFGGGGGGGSYVKASIHVKDLDKMKLKVVVGSGGKGGSGAKCPPPDWDMEFGKNGTDTSVISDNGKIKLIAGAGYGSRCVGNNGGKVKSTFGASVEIILDGQDGQYNYGTDGGNSPNGGSGGRGSCIGAYGTSLCNQNGKPGMSPGGGGGGGGTPIFCDRVPYCSDGGDGADGLAIITF